jgi:hypothetical protein
VQKLELVPILLYKEGMFVCLAFFFFFFPTLPTFKFFIKNLETQKIGAVKIISKLRSEEEFLCVCVLSFTYFIDLLLFWLLSFAFVSFFLSLSLSMCSSLPLSLALISFHALLALSHCSCEEAEAEEEEV